MDNDMGRVINDYGTHVIISGTFSQTVDFDPGPGTTNLTSNGYGDAYIQKVDANGNFSSPNVDFNPESSSFNLSVFNYYLNAFTLKWNQDIPANIKKNDVSNSFQLYPNPTKGNITIDLREQKQNIKATLTNSLGQLILTQQFESTDIINMNIDIPTGIYILQLETDNRETKTIKVLKE
jgi:hypothetical protein